MAKVSHKINLSDVLSESELSKLNRSQKKEIKEELGELLYDMVLKDTSNERSAVTGQKWKGLSKEYKKEKRKVASGKANLELSGAMLDSLKVKNTAEGIEIGVFNTKQAKKADGHCHTGIFGTSSLPERKFIPNEDENYRTGIIKELKRLAKDLVSGD